MTFGRRIIAFNRDLKPDWEIPPGIELLYPYEGAETQQALTRFYEKFYSDEEGRIGLFGINPGRFGAGVTGVPFTDPIRLAQDCGIENGFSRKPELSSAFVYEVVRAWGGPETFYRHFYITSLSPLGFVRNGKNYNYYDDKVLQHAIEPHIVDHLRTQLGLGVKNRIALCLGRGKNSTVFENLNATHGFFGEIRPLPHPRWVMQYRRKRMNEYVDLYLEELQRAVALSENH